MTYDFLQPTLDTKCPRCGHASRHSAGESCTTTGCGCTEVGYSPAGLFANDAQFFGLDFAYGNLAASTNHKPSRESFRKLALEKGFSEDWFESWAAGKEWK
jgi:hypothetical protein